MNNALLTGSRVYGTPGDDSDVDLVVLMDPAESAALAKILGKGPEREGEQYEMFQFKSGILNVIVETRFERFEAWTTGTEFLRKVAPVKREFAVETFKRLFEKAGEPCPNPSPSTSTQN